MDREVLSTAPSALSGTATGATYSRDTIVLLAIAQYITNLGYQAIASMNDSALAIPLAIKAGLGEYGRHGLLITREYGPRVRLGKVFTDMPLAHRPARPVRREGNVRHLPRVHERLPRQGHRRRRTVHRGPQPVEHPGHPQMDHGRREVLSASGPTRTPTARSACASARTTATIAPTVESSVAMACGHAAQATRPLAGPRERTRRAPAAVALVERVIAWTGTAWNRRDHRPVPAASHKGAKLAFAKSRKRHRVGSLHSVQEVR